MRRYEDQAFGAGCQTPVPLARSGNADRGSLCGGVPRSRAVPKSEPSPECGGVDHGGLCLRHGCVRLCARASSGAGDLVGGGGVCLFVAALHLPCSATFCNVDGPCCACCRSLRAAPGRRRRCPRGDHQTSFGFLGQRTSVSRAIFSSWRLRGTGCVVFPETGEGAAGRRPSARAGGVLRAGRARCPTGPRRPPPAW